MPLVLRHHLGQVPHRRPLDLSHLIEMTRCGAAPRSQDFAATARDRRSPPAHAAADLPRAHHRPAHPLSRRAPGLQADLPRQHRQPDPHNRPQGSEWFSVLAVDCDSSSATRTSCSARRDPRRVRPAVPHWIGSADGDPSGSSTRSARRASGPTRPPNPPRGRRRRPRHPAVGSRFSLSRARYSAAASSAICRRDTSAERIVCDRGRCRATGAADRHSGLQQAQRVGDAFVAERVELRGGDVGRVAGRKAAPVPRTARWARSPGSAATSRPACRRSSRACR